MRALIFNLPSAVWLVLMLATGLSWWLGNAHGLGSDGGNIQRASVIVLVVAFFKVRLVIRHFMEVRTAPLPLRLVMDGWIFTVSSLVIGLYLWGGSAG